MPIPKYFVMERAKALKERQKVLEQILAKVRPQDSDMVRYNMYFFPFAFVEVVITEVL